MVQQTILVGMSLSEFIDEYAKTPFELADGRVSLLRPNILGHQLVVKTLFRLLDFHVTAEKLGEVLFETPFVISDKPDWVKGSRTPDLSYFGVARWTAYLLQSAEVRRKPILLVPDLAVEVVSPNDLYSEIQDKIDGYMADGVQMVWVIDPQRRTVLISTAASDSQTTLREGSTLAGGDMLPTFSVAVKRRFE